MPFMTNGKRDYKKENLKYNSSPKQKKQRAMRNAARAPRSRLGSERMGQRLARQRRAYTALLLLLAPRRRNPKSKSRSDTRF